MAKKDNKSGSYKSYKNGCSCTLDYDMSKISYGGGGGGESAPPTPHMIIKNNCKLACIARTVKHG